MMRQMTAIANRSRTIGGVPTALSDIGYIDVGLGACSFQRSLAVVLAAPRRLPHCFRALWQTTTGRRAAATALKDSRTTTSTAAPSLTRNASRICWR